MEEKIHVVDPKIWNKGFVVVIVFYFVII